MLRINQTFLECEHDTYLSHGQVKYLTLSDISIFYRFAGSFGKLHFTLKSYNLAMYLCKQNCTIRMCLSKAIEIN